MKRYKEVFALNGTVLLFMAGVGMIVALLPRRMLVLSDSVSQVGWLASVFAVPYILFQLPAGRLADRIGFKALISGGYFLCALAGLIYYSAETSSAMLLGRMIQGIGEAPLWSLAPALLALRFSAERGAVLGMYNASIHLGLTAGSCIGILFFPVWHESGSFLFFSAVGLIGGLVNLFCIRDAGRPAPEEPVNFDSGQVWTLIHRGQMAPALFNVLLYGAGYGIFLTAVPAFFIKERDAGQASVGLMFTMFYAAIGLSQLLSGFLPERCGTRRPMICSMLMAALGMASFCRLLQPWSNLMLFIAALGLGLFAVSSMVFLNRGVPDSLRGTISGAFYLFWGTGFFIGPLMLGSFTTVKGFETGFMTVAACFLCGGIVLLCTGKNMGKQ
jgi:MFS family permease